MLYFPTSSNYNALSYNKTGNTKLQAYYLICQNLASLIDLYNVRYLYVFY